MVSWCFRFVVVLAAMMCIPSPSSAVAPPADVVINEFDKPLLFAYLSWDGKAVTEKGQLVLRIENGKGGCGDNIEGDFSGQADWSPSVRVTAGAGHKAKVVRVMLRDDKDGEGTWDFALDGLQSGESVTLTPREGASLKQPNSIGKKGAVNPAKVRQCQVMGDWSGDPLDLRIERIILTAPTKEILALRETQQKRHAAEAEALRKMREELKAKYAAKSEKSPSVEHVSAVAADVLALDIQAGRLIPSRLEKYQPQPGDVRREKKGGDGSIEAVILDRGGREVGWLVGRKQEWLTTYEAIEGDPLLDFVADDLANYAVSSPDDPGFREAIKPIAVFRKSRANEWAQGPAEVAVRHSLYLKLPRSFRPGCNYVITLGDVNTRQAQVQLAFEPKKIRSDAVHVNQIGYRADDPVKRAFVSCWLGVGGPLVLPEQLEFWLVDDATAKVVFTGQAERHFPADKLEKMAREANFSGTDVARCDFSAFKTPGRYRLAVQGVGCSYPFEIGRDAWKKAFITQMRGLYNNRSGIELGPPYGDFKKPRDMHPADGYRVTKTKYRTVEKGGEAWGEIVGGDTGESVPEGWGGYHDAGDWNPRRVSHMRVTMASLQVMEMFPEYFAAVKLNIPPTVGVPDILSEAMFEFDCFRRLQQPDGGVPYGMESKGDPLAGEVSWLNSFSSYVMTADYAASWYYAAVGARLSSVLQKYDAKRAAGVRDSAIRAFEFAEKDFARDAAAGLTEKREETWRHLDDRNLAALELYRLTGQEKYHALFLENSALKDETPDLFVWTKHVQREHAFVYAQLPEGKGDVTLKKKAVAAIEDMARRSLAYAGGNALNLTTCDRGKPQFIGFYSTPDANDLVYAHFLTKKPEYLAGVVQATQFQSGCNPNNLVYTSGLGANPVKHPFKLDARRTGQKVPEGLTPFGNVDLSRWNDNGITWPITWVIGKATVPDAYAWPVNEAYWDLGGWPMLEEYTVDMWAPNVLVWGYLAARK